MPHSNLTATVVETHLTFALFAVLGAFLATNGRRWTASERLI